MSLSNGIRVSSFRPKFCEHNKNPKTPNHFIVKLCIVYNSLHVSARKEHYRAFMGRYNQKVSTCRY
jgi:hypothetical protein